MSPRFYLVKVAFFTMAIACFSTCNNAAVIINGGFEQSVLSVPNTVYTPGSNSLTGWTISGSSGIDHVGSLWQAAEGSQSISLNWTSPSSISQTVTTVPNLRYSLTFSLAAELPELNSTVRTIDILWNANLVDSLSIDPSGKNSANMGWQSFSYTVNGSGSDTLMFRSTTDGAYGPAVDNISITPVPEPTACFIYGCFTAICCFGRIRNRVNARIG